MVKIQRYNSGIFNRLKFHPPSGAAFKRLKMNRNMIRLSPAEHVLRNCLLGCRARMIDEVPGMKDLELRWTGGWVRDKLLGSTSHDIDVALSSMTGWQFGQALQKYMQENADEYEKQAANAGIKSEIKNIHKIEANPEKSKHLETITTRMFGIDLDFVNLRKEVYHDNSRNPQMEFGTPEEDALRRDACVNALFYNLDTQEVEDYTKRGLMDMDAKWIRTPLDPYQTFKDDPLRVLRLIRFAARLGYTIDKDALEAMADPRIHEALRLKISRERVGVEVGKIMIGPDPFGGLTLIYDQNLYTTVFADPEPQAARREIAESEFKAAIDALRQVLTECASICFVLKPTDDMVVACTLAAYVPYRQNEEDAVTAARNSIKATNLVSKILGDAVKFRPRISDLVRTTGSGEARRSEVGIALREFGKSWRSHVLYSLLCDMVSQDVPQVIVDYSAFVRYVQDQNLADAAEVKPILNGNDIKKALDIAKAGSWLKDVLDLVVEWQFAHPQGTADEARKMIISKKDQFTPHG